MRHSPFTLSVLVFRAALHTEKNINFDGTSEDFS